MQLTESVEFGYYFKKARVNLGLTQAYVSSTTKITRTIISNIECGRIKNPHLSTVLKLAKAVNLDLGVTDNVSN